MWSTVGQMGRPIVDAVISLSGGVPFWWAHHVDMWSFGEWQLVRMAGERGLCAPKVQRVLNRLANHEYIKLCGDGTCKLMRGG